jgi:hypothetical protein
MGDARASFINVTYTLRSGESAVTHGLRMKLGTAQALGLNSNLFQLGFVVKPVAHNGYSRRMYPGGPSVQVAARTTQRAVAVGPRQTRARTNSKMYVRGKNKGEEAVIYFSGPQAAAAAWLKNNSSIDFGSSDNAIGLYTSKGRPLFVKTASV